MQIIASKQLISDRLGYARALTLMAINSFYTGCFILLGIATPVLSLKLVNLPIPLIAPTLGALLVGFLLSGFITKSFVKDCYHNQPLQFPLRLLVTVGCFWLGLVLIFSLGFDQILTDGLAAGLWAIAAMTFLMMSLRLYLTNKASTTDKPSKIDQLNIVTYADQTLSLSPTALIQQPRQFSSLMTIILSLFLWTMVDLPVGVVEIMAIALACLGLTGLSTWQMHIDPEQRSLYMHFSGIWGMAASYTINIKNFSRLEIIKLKEGDLNWLQLVGNGTDLALPGVVSDYTHKNAESNQIAKTLLQSFNLARHETIRDSLELIGILLPQSAGMLAGVAFLGCGVAVLLLLPLPPRMPLEGLIFLVSTCLLSPAIARSLLHLVAPNYLLPDAASCDLPPWQIGAAMMMTVVLLQPQTGGLANLGLAWLSCGIGSCILALSRRSPLVSQR
jgi:hypothetical protein